MNPTRTLFPVKVILSSHNQAAAMSENKDKVVELSSRYQFCPDRSLITSCIGRAPIYLRPVKITKKKKPKPKNMQKQSSTHGGKYLAVITAGADIRIKRGIVTRVIHGAVRKSPVTHELNRKRQDQQDQGLSLRILRTELRKAIPIEEHAHICRTPRAVPVRPQPKQSHLESKPSIPMTASYESNSLPSTRSTTPMFRWPATSQYLPNHDFSMFTVDSERAIVYSDSNQDPNLPSNYEMYGDCSWQISDSYFC